MKHEVIYRGFAGDWPAARTRTLTPKLVKAQVQTALAVSASIIKKVKAPETQGVLFE